MKVHTQLVKRFFAVLLFSTLVLVFPNAPAADSFDGGIQAYKTKNYQKALEIFKPLAEQGHLKAQSALRLMADKSEEVPREDAEAAQSYRKAAEQGNPKAQSSLGLMYDNGAGVPQDYAEAVKWYRKAAEQGMPSAQYNLGLMYLNGEGVPQDYVEAVKW